MEDQNQEASTNYRRGNWSAGKGNSGFGKGNSSTGTGSLGTGKKKFFAWKLIIQYFHKYKHFVPINCNCIDQKPVQWYSVRDSSSSGAARNIADVHSPLGQCPL